MLPISDIPVRLREFAALFRTVFHNSAQRDHFEQVLAGLIACENRTVAGIHQSLVSSTDYDSLHHFMTDSPWSHNELREQRLSWAKNNLPVNEKSPKVIAIDSTLVHHSGEHIYGVYWYWDYVKQQFCLGQKIVVASYVSTSTVVPLGMELYHRGFLNEQKLYLEQTKPQASASQQEWDEYNALVSKYEENIKEHKTQLDLAKELVDECERHGFQKDAYVVDGGFLNVELMDKIESYNQAWVSRLAKNRLVQLPSGKFDTAEAFAKSLPREVFSPVVVRTRHGKERTYWVFAKNVKVKFWKKLRLVISYDNPDLEGEPKYFISNKLNWIQAQKILQPYMFRDPIEHFFRDEKQELGLEECQQRKEQAVLRFWELCFVAHTFLEMKFRVDQPADMAEPIRETIGQKCRHLKMNFLQSFIDDVKALLLDQQDPKELINLLTRKCLNGLAC